MAGGNGLKILPHWGRWQREALMEGGVAQKAATAAARSPAQFSLAPRQHLRWVSGPKGGGS